MDRIRLALLVVSLGVGLAACSDRGGDASQVSVGTGDDASTSTGASSEPEPTSAGTSAPEVDPTPSLGARVIYSEGPDEYGTRIRLVDDSGAGGAAPVTLLEWAEPPVNDPLYLSPSRRWAVLTSDYRIWVTDLADAAAGPPVEVVPDQPGWTLALRVSDDDRWLAFASGDRLQLCELAPGGCVPEPYGPPSPWFGDLAFGPLGRHFAYTMETLDGSPTRVVLGRLGAPDEATVLGSLATNISNIRFGRDERTLYFTGSAYNGGGDSGMYAADLTAEPPTAVRISEAFSENGWGCDWGVWAPDLSGFLWHSYDCPGALWWVPLSGAETGAPVRVSSSAAGDGRAWSISPDSRRFLFSSDHEAAGTFDLYQVNVEAIDAAPIKLNAPLVDLTQVDFPSFLAGSPRVMYLARGIFVADPDAPGAAIRVDSSNGELAYDQPLVSADASRLLYIEYESESGDADALQYVDISGATPGPAVDITPELSGSRRRVMDRRFSDDGRRVYLQTLDDAGTRLFRVDLSGPTPFAATELSGPGEQVWRYEVVAPLPTTSG